MPWWKCSSSLCGEVYRAPTESKTPCPVCGTQDWPLPWAAVYARQLGRMAGPEALYEIATEDEPDTVMEEAPLDSALCTAAIDLIHSGVSNLYLAGPMRGYPKFNFPAFDAQAAILRRLGFTVVSPADIDREEGFNPSVGLPEGEEETFARQAIIRDVEAICKLDAVVVLPGWEKSRGSAVEVATARFLGIPVLDALTLEPIEAAIGPATQTSIRHFETGATRNDDSVRDDPEGYLSPLSIQRFCQYMTKHRHLEDGSIRDSDNWQKGIPLDTYMKGLWRHFHHLWLRHRGWPVQDPKAGRDIEEDLCAILFNAQGYLHEVLRKDAADRLLTEEGAEQIANNVIDAYNGV